jgi:hypothetical protein
MSTVKSQSARKLLPGVLALALCAAIPAWAQDPTPAPAAPAATAADADDASDDNTEETVLRFDNAITPEARAVMDRMKAAMTGLQRFTLTAEVSRDEALSYGYKIQHNEFVDMDVERPSKLKVDVDGDLKNRTYYFDGTTFTVLAKDLNVYAKKPISGTTADLVGELLERGFDMPLIDVLYQGQAGDLLDDVRVGIVVGDSTVNGEAVTHLAFRQPDVDWQLWVSKSSSLPRKIVITTRYSVGDPQYQAVLHWNTSPKFAASNFNFVPAKGVTLIQMQKDEAASGGAQ